MEPSKVRQLHFRVDPPVDQDYLALLEKITQRMGGEKSILSPPAIIRAQSEKIPPIELTHLAPATQLVRNAQDLDSALERFRGVDKLVTKPVNQAQSKGVKLWDLKTEDLRSIDLSSPVVVQEYLPDVHRGETRMWFAAGQFVAALKKHPKAGDFRVLIDEGSKIEACTLTPQERSVAEQVGSVLKKQGVALAAIDFISGKISDYNITSPGLLVQLEQVHGKNYAREILEKIWN